MRSEKTRATRIIAEYAVFILLFLLIAVGLTALLLFLTGPSSAVVNASEPPYQTVILDAGHGGEDGGAIGHLGGEEIYEKDLNLSITFMLRDMLEAEGISVILTREEDVLLYDRNTDYHGRKKVLDLAARLHVGQSSPGAVFISIHMNAFTQTQYKGLQVYYSPNHSLSATLAKDIQTLTAQQLQPDNDRPIKRADSSIFLLDRLSCPAVLVECGFLSNPDDCRLLSQPQYQQKVAFLLFCGIRQTLQESSNEDSGTYLPAKTQLLLPEDLIFEPECFIMGEDIFDPRRRMTA